MSLAEQQFRLRRALEERGICDERVLDTMQHTRRDLFVPTKLADRAYRDEALPIGFEQTISQPYIVALMTQALELKGDERVLEIGTGSGYQTFILAQLCEEVVSIERIEELADIAERRLAEVGVTNVDLRMNDGTLGCEGEAPFDAILVTAAGPDVPAPLYRQLKDGGRLVIPIGAIESQELTLIEKRTNGPHKTKLCDCRFVKLLGDAGWLPWEY